MMESNKDEALRCVRIAEEAIASANKDRAFRFIKIAMRLDQNLPLDELLVACEELNSVSDDTCSVAEDRGDSGQGGGSNGVRGCAEEHFELIERIRRNKDYYVVLGVEKTCSGEDIKRAYRKLSLKVHPDKNKAPAAEEAFKKVCKAFKCLSEEESRRQYDQMGFIGESQYSNHYNVGQWRRSRRRRRTVDDLFDDEFDTDYIYRPFYDQPNMFQTSYVYRSRGMQNRDREGHYPGKFIFLLLLQVLPLLLIVLLASLSFSEPKYSLYKNYSYQIPKTTEKHGVDFFVKSTAFDQRFPLGSPVRANMEDNVFKDYKNMLWRYCQAELQRLRWAKNLPTPHCNKLHKLGVA